MASNTSSNNLEVHSVARFDLDKTSKAKLLDYEQHPENWQGQQLIEVARIYMGIADYQAAQGILRKLLSKQPDNTDAIRNLGNCSWLTGDYDKATLQFKKGWAMGDDRSLVNMANMYFSSASYQNIKPLIPDLLKIQKRLIDADCKHEVCNVLIAYSLNALPIHDKDVFLKATEGLTDAFFLEREDTAQFFILALKEFGYQDRAEQFSKKIEAENQKRAAAIFHDGVTKYDAGDLIGAEDAFTRAATLNSNKMVIYYNLGLVKYDLEKFDESVAAYSKAISLNPTNWPLYYALGRVKYRLGKHDESIAAFSKSIELAPHDPQIWNCYVNRGVARQVSGDFSGAIADYNKTIELNPTNALAFKNLGLAQVYLFQWRPALENLRRSLQFEPALAYPHFYIWMIRTRLGEPTEATKELNEYVKPRLAAGGKDMSVFIGQFLLGDLSEDAFLKAAMTSAKGDLQIKNQVCQVYYFIGIKHLLAGDKPGAAEAFKEAIEIPYNIFEFQNAQAELDALKSNSRRQP